MRERALYEWTRLDRTIQVLPETFRTTSGEWDQQCDVMVAHELARLAIENAKLWACLRESDEVRAITADTYVIGSDFKKYDAARAELDS